MNTTELRQLIAELKGAYASVALQPGMQVRVEMLGQMVQGKVRSSQMGSIVIETPQGNVEIHTVTAGDEFVMGGYTRTRRGKQ
jgi:hypothetical protein